MLKKVSERIETLFDEWEKLQPLKPSDQERWEKKVKLNWNYHSNHIEGNTLSYNETEMLLVHGRCEGGHLERDYMEMKAPQYCH